MRRDEGDRITSASKRPTLFSKNAVIECIMDRSEMSNAQHFQDAAFAIEMGLSETKPWWETMMRRGMAASSVTIRLAAVPSP